MTDALDDIFVQELILEFGSNGYLVFFGLIEIIAKENGKILTGKLEISPAILKQKFHISERKIEEILKFCSRKLKVLFDNSEKKWKLEIPKMLKFKDNYTSDLEAASKNIASHIRDRDKREDKEKKTSLRDVKEKQKKSFTETPENFTITDSMREWFADKKSGLNIETETQAFLDHSKANGKIFKDWIAAWRTWMTNAKKYAEAAIARNGKPKRESLESKYTHVTGEIA
jgi:hypothetical protein